MVVKSIANWDWIASIMLMQNGSILAAKGMLLAFVLADGNSSEEA
jgi:hypothetical protein